MDSVLRQREQLEREREREGERKRASTLTGLKAGDGCRLCDLKYNARERWPDDFQLF